MKRFEILHFLCSSATLNTLNKNTNNSGNLKYILRERHRERQRQRLREKKKEEEEGGGGELEKKKKKRKRSVTQAREKERSVAGVMEEILINVSRPPSFCRFAAQVRQHTDTQHFLYGARLLLCLWLQLFLQHVTSVVHADWHTQRFVARYGN